MHAWLNIVLGILYVGIGIAIAEAWSFRGGPDCRRWSAAYLVWLALWPVMVAVMLVVGWEDW